MRPRLIACAGILSFAVGCAGGASNGGTGGASAGTGGTGGGATGTGGTGGSGTCPSRDFSDTTNCNNLVNDATMIDGTIETGAVPAFTGGTIADGLYHSARLQFFNAAAGTTGTRRVTIAVTGGGTRFFWAIEAAASGVMSQGRISTAASTSGNSLNQAMQCMTGGANLPATLSYTATADQMILALPGAMTTVTTYQRSGCP